MSKLYVFGIGGTGSRVLRSLTMLLAAGVDCNVDTIVPIIIDRDIGNGDLTRTKSLIDDYMEVNNIANTNGENKFFKTKISLLNDKLFLQLQDNTERFGDFIGRGAMSDNNKALVDMLFSNETLALDMTAGFQGNPNIGSVVLNQFENNDIISDFAQDFNDGDKIFIISSIFGGTGASGFPLLRKMIHTPNVAHANGQILPNWGLINNAKIGAITVLPYFDVGNPNQEGGLVNSDTFIDKTRAALTYYKNEDKKIDTLYYIGHKLTSTYNYNTGGIEQMNNAHFVELAAALAILDFINIQNFNRNAQDIIVNTTYKEFGVKEFGENDNTSELTFDNLADITKGLIVNPLSRFLLFAKYMGNQVVKIQRNGRDESVVEKRNDIFEKENKHQPFARGRFTGDFRNDNSIQKLESFQKKFVEWLLEMEKQELKFTPFNLSSSSATDFIKGNLRIINPDNFMYKNWARVDNELNRQISKTNKSLENDKRFIELFSKVTKKLINFIN